MKYTCVGGTVIIALLFNVGNATVWYVHPDSTMNCIQHALDSCSTGDTVLVGPGTYYENILWPNTQGIELIGEVGPDTTIIDGDNGGTVITIISGADSTTILKGLSIQNGEAAHGGGIRCENSSPRFDNLIITENTAYYWDGPAGGGLYFSNSNSTLLSVNINNNQTSSFNDTDVGGGIYCQSSNLKLTNVTISDNTALCGGGLACTYGSPILTKVDILRNKAWTWIGGGIYCMGTSSPNIDSSSISNNAGDGVYCQNSSNPTINWTNIHGNTGYAIYSSSSATINAEYNWWGDSGGPPSNAIYGQVDYDPWLTDSVHWQLGISMLEVITPLIIDVKVIPNPFTHMTDIRYQITDNRGQSAGDGTTLRIYDATGRLVRDLGQLSVIGHQSSVSWDGTDQANRQLGSGVYFIKLTAGDYEATEKVLYVR